MPTWPRGARAYVALLAAVAVGVELLSILVVTGLVTFSDPMWAAAVPPRATTLEALVVLAPVCVLTSFKRSRLRIPVGLSLNAPILLASYLIAGPFVAALIGSVDLLTRMRAPLIKRAFNAAQFILMAFAGGVVYIALGGVLADSFTSHDFAGSVLAPMALSSLVAMVVNALLIIGIMRWAEHVSALSVWRTVFSGSLLPYLAYGLLGLLMAVLWSVGSPLAAILVVIPILVARWAYQQYAEQLNAYEATIRSLVKAVETKDAYTRGHSERVSRASVLIARHRGMTEDRVALLGYAGILHDVGKLGVPTRVLQKTGPLTDREYALVQRHPGIGQELIREIAFLREAYEGILHHHERLDGRGYPDGQRAEQIPEFARIIAVADAFDSMTSTRSYLGARTVDEALAELDRHGGSQFDRAMVDALVAALVTHPWTHTAAPAGVESTVADASGAGFVLDHDDPTVGMSVAINQQRAEDAIAAQPVDEPQGRAS